MRACVLTGVRHSSRAALLLVDSIHNIYQKINNTARKTHRHPFCYCVEMKKKRSNTLAAALYRSPFSLCGEGIWKFIFKNKNKFLSKNPGVFCACVSFELPPPYNYINM